MLKNLFAALSALLILSTPSIVHASRRPSVVLYCVAPNAACDMAQTRLESVGARFALVRAWADEDSFDEYSIVVDTYGLNPESTLPVTVIEDSVVVGVEHIASVYNLVRSNR